MELCREAGTGESGLITKCDRLITALTYLKLQRTTPTQTSRHSEVIMAMERIQSWKPSLRKMKKRKENLSQAEQREKKYDIDTLTAITCHRKLWKDFNSNITKARQQSLLKDEHQLCTAAIAAMLLFNDAQRPGAVMGATVEEFDKVRITQGVYVMYVKEHKTSTSGPARLTMTKEDYERVTNYVNTVRRQLDPRGVTPQLLLVDMEEQIHKVNPLLKYLEGRYKTAVPTATTLRKAVATRAALTCSPGDVRVLTKQMSHSVETHRRKYEELDTAEGAAMSHRIIQDLAKVARVTVKPVKLVTSRIAYSESEEEEIYEYFT